MIKTNSHKLSGATIPDHWTKMDGSNVYQLVQLTPTDAEYQKVSQEFQKTCKRTLIKVCKS